METSSAQVTDNPTKARFELPLSDGDIGIIGYEHRGDVYALTHTEVPPAYRGQGRAEALVEGTLNLIEAQGAKIIPLCPYVQVYLKRHPEWERIVKKG